MSVETTYQSRILTVETLEVGVPASGGTAARVTHGGYDRSETIDATTAVPATKTAYFEKAMAAGAGTIDLTALTGTNGAAVDFTGLKVQCARFRAKSDNAGNVTLTEGAANGYELLGNAWALVLKPDQEVTVFLKDLAPDVAAGAKNIDLAGTGTDKVLCSLVAG